MAFGSTRQAGGRLPVEVTSFVGRTAELADVRRRLGVARMVTLVGPGGVGKTRLAMRAAVEAADRYADGVRLVELSGLKGAELLPNAVCEALGLPEQSSRPQIDAVVEHLAERELLLVLDTCEHLLDACALLADLLLPQAPRLTVLATSRQALDVPGEHVPPLPLPDDGADDGADDDGDALTLFAQRAAAVVPGFALTDANRAQAAALCRRLDGIPLAIELATVRLRALPLDELVARLSDTFALLTGGRLTTLPRHQTLRTTIGWSHELCSPAERLLWARLSVFAGSFDLAAVEAVCTDAELPAASVLEPLISLVDKSVVLRIGHNSHRYRLLDTIREYGAEWLSSTGEKEDCRRRHIAHYRSLLRHFADRFHTSQQVPLFRALAVDHENLRAALQYALADGQLIGQTVVMWPFWVCAGQPAEGRSWMDKALELHPQPTAERAETLVWYGTFTVYQGDHETTQRVAGQARTLAEELGDERLTAFAVMHQGLGLSYAGDHETGKALLHEARDRMRALRDPLGMLIGAGRMCVASATARDPDATMAAFDEVMQLVGEDSEEAALLGYVFMAKGIAHLARGETMEAGHCGALWT